MFCTTCGSEIPEGSKFCTSCGAPVPVRSDAGGEKDAQPGAAPVPAAAPVPEAPRRRRRGPIVAIVVSLLVILLAAGALVTHQLGLWGGSDVPVVSFGSREAVRVSRVTRIVPQGTDGAPIARYVVRVREATGTDGRFIDVSELPQLDVDGETGFTMADFGELADGTYEVTVTSEGGAPQSLPPVSVVSEGADGGADNGSGTAAEQLPEQIVVAPPADAGQDGSAAPVRLGRYGAFLKVVRDLQQTYGEVTIVQGGYAGDSLSATWLSGVCYVRLIDFGDGVERLVVAYASDPSVSAAYPSSTDAYTVEVWDYDEAADAASKVWSGHHGYSNGGYAFVTLVPSADASRTYLEQDLSDAGANYVGIRDDGSFGLAHTVEYEPHFGADGMDGYTVLVDGTAIDGETSQDADSVMGIDRSGTTNAMLTEDELSYVGEVEKTADETRETVGRLESLAGDLVDAADAAGAGSEEPATDPASLTYTGTEQRETVTLPTWDNSTMTPTDPTDVQWGYVSISADGDGSAVDAVNERLRADFEAERAQSESWTLDSGDSETLERRSSMDAQFGQYVGVRVYRQVTNWGAHGGEELDGLVFDMATGQEAEPWDALGVSRADLDAAAVEAIVSYVTTHPQAALYTDEATVRQEAQKYVASGDHYLLTPYGITVYLGDYSFYPFSEGTREVVAWGVEGTATGVDVSGDYRFQ